MALMPDGANGSREVILTPEWEYGGATLRDVGKAGTSLAHQTAMASPESSQPKARIKFPS